MWKSAPAAMAAILTLSLAGEASAQGFLKNLARQAAAAAIQQAAQPSASPDDEAPPTAAAGPAVPPPRAKSRPKTLADIARPADAPERKKAFETFSRVHCNDCEGGYAYDAWAKHHVKVGYEYNAFENRIGGLALGEAVTWQGAASRGSITVVGEDPVDGFRCKQLTWALVKGAERAERPGLYCFGYAGPSSGAETWVEIY